MQPLAGEAIRSATFIAAQSQTDYERFLSLGAQPERLAMVGNLKFDYELPEATTAAGLAWRSEAGGERPIWIAASTHEGEEQAVLAAHAQVLQRFPDALLVLAPRHPERFRAVAHAAEAAGLRVRTRSEHQRASAATQCFVADSLGELMVFFVACDVAFVAGSLEPIGGHNVLEPALAGRAIVVGPHTFNFAEVTDLLLEAGAALRVPGPERLGQAVIEAARRSGTPRRHGRSRRRRDRRPPRGPGAHPVGDPAHRRLNRSPPAGRGGAGRTGSPPESQAPVLR